MVQDFGVKWSTLSGAVGRQRFDADPDLTYRF
jgi:hypothetical protein